MYPWHKYITGRYLCGREDLLAGRRGITRIEERRALIGGVAHDLIFSIGDGIAPIMARRQQPLAPPSSPPTSTSTTIYDQCCCPRCWRCGTTHPVTILSSAGR